MLECLERAVGGAVMRARAAERALHGRGAWSLEVGGQRVACDRHLGADRIVFVGVLTEPVAGPVLQVLRCGEDVVDVTMLDAPEACGDAPGWTEVVHEIRVAA